MTSFVHVHYPAEHPGVARAESVIAAARQMRRQFDGTRGLAAVLLAAVVSALVVAADRLVESWADGGLLFAWVALWAVAFAAIALFAGATRRTAHRVVRTLDAWSYRIAQKRADERLWSAAQSDPRVMADLQAAMTRSQAPAASVAAPSRRSLREVVETWRAEAVRARADAQLWNVAKTDHRVMADLQAAKAHAEGLSEVADAVPAVTRTLLRAEKAAEQRGAAYSRQARLAYYM